MIAFERHAKKMLEDREKRGKRRSPFRYGKFNRSNKTFIEFD